DVRGAKPVGDRGYPRRKRQAAVASEGEEHPRVGGDAREPAEPHRRHRHGHQDVSEDRAQSAAEDEDEGIVGCQRGGKGGGGARMLRGTASNIAYPATPLPAPASTMPRGALREGSCVSSQTWALAS